MREADVPRHASVAFLKTYRWWIGGAVVVAIAAIIVVFGGIPGLTKDWHKDAGIFVCGCQARYRRQNAGRGERIHQPALWRTGDCLDDRV